MGMNPDLFQDAERLFHAACGLHEDEREAFIMREAGDAQLASSVLRLLAYEERRGVTSGLAAADPSDSTCLLGHEIGRYRVRDVLGEGGFGAVYLADQMEPVRREVALKLLHPGTGARRVIMRFEAERQALAMMDHPGIARVLDAGETDGVLGVRPYFAMELVRGSSIIEYADAHRLTVHERLRVFVEVCRAVQHAHQKGVIHRDLKPSNILIEAVDGVAMPKVIDFGIAKALEHPLTSDPLVTEARQLLGTPRYMSPEQADMDGVSVDTRSDIYALGVVLYELLTGVTPLDDASLREIAVAELRQLIADAPTPLPSTSVARADSRAEIATARGTDSVNLRRTIAGDIDWIVLKALEKDRDRRYQSASEFADDIERYLAHRPVLAGPPTVSYRVRKFVRRHRLAFSTLALVVMATAIGAGGLIAGAVRVRKEAESRAAVNAFLSELLISIEPQRGGADVRVVDVLEDASSQVGERFADHPMQRATVHDLLGRIYRSVGFSGSAAEQHVLALEIWRREVGPGDARAIRAQLDASSAYLHIVELDEASTLIDDLVFRLSRHGANEPEMLECMGLVAEWHRLSGRLDESERVARETLRQVLEHQPNRADLAAALREVMLNTLPLRARRLKDEGAESERDILLDELIGLAVTHVDDMERAYGPSSPRAWSARERLARTHLSRGEFDDAADVATALLTETAGTLHECHFTRLGAASTYCKVLAARGDYGEASELLLLRIDCLRGTVSISNPLLLSALSDSLPYLDYGGRWEEGEAHARELVDAFSRIRSPTHVETVWYRVYVARFLSRLGRVAEADELFATLRPIYERAPDSPQRARMFLFYGAHLASVGRYEEAEINILRASRITGSPQRGTWRLHARDILYEFIALYEAWGRPDEAARYRAMLSTTPVAAE